MTKTLAKKLKKPASSARPSGSGMALVKAIAHLDRRVGVLELAFSGMGSDVSALKQDVTSLKTSVKRMDERTRRGEVVLLEMQGEQRKMVHVLERIATAVRVGSPALEEEPTAETLQADEAEALADSNHEDE